MKPFTLKKRKKREVWVVRQGPEVASWFHIRDAHTQCWLGPSGEFEVGVAKAFGTRTLAEAYAKSKKWKVV